MKLLIVIAIVILIIWWAASRPAMSHYRFSGIDLDVCKEFPNSHEAAKLLARTCERIMIFLAYLRTRYFIGATDEEIGNKIAEEFGLTRAHVIALLRGFNPEVLIENMPGRDGTAYTVDKGRKMVLCLRDVNNPLQLVSDDVLMFVVLHECSHIADFANWGHKPEYWAIFRAMLRHAERAGVYAPRDYRRLGGITYCGMQLKYNPYFDP